MFACYVARSVQILLYRNIYYTSLLKYFVSAYIKKILFHLSTFSLYSLSFHKNNTSKVCMQLQEEIKLMFWSVLHKSMKDAHSENAHLI